MKKVRNTQKRGSTSLVTHFPAEFGREASSVTIFPPNDRSPAWRFLLSEAPVELQPQVTRISVHSTDSLLLTEYYVEDTLFYFTVKSRGCDE